MSYTPEEQEILDLVARTRGQEVADKWAELILDQARSVGVLAEAEDEGDEPIVVDNGVTLESSILRWDDSQEQEIRREVLFIGPNGILFTLSEHERACSYLVLQVASCPWPDEEEEKWFASLVEWLTQKARALRELAEDADEPIVTDNGGETRK